MVTIRDIANEANVSIATVSMALNDKDCITPKTKKKVLAAARKLNYIPSASAQVLKTRRSRTLGLVVGNLSNTYFSDIVSAAEEMARSMDYSLFICDAGMSAKNALRSFRDLQIHNVDGIMFSLSLNVDEQFTRSIEEITRRGTKMVSLTRCVEQTKIPIVTFTDAEQVYGVVSRLVALGHRRIAAIGGPEGCWMNDYRLNIFKRVMREHDILDESRIVYAPLSIEGGKEQALRLLQEHPDITAIYGINDLIALGVLKAAEELELRVPEDLSIIGSDGIPYVMFTKPRLTTIVTPRREIGRIAAKTLIHMIEGKEDPVPRVTLIPCEVDMGGSVAPPQSVDKVATLADSWLAP